MDKFRDRKFCLVLYEDDETHKNALDLIKKNYDFAMIRHDKDVDDEGNLKKPHFHVVLKFKNAVWSTSLASDLGIGENYLEKCRSLDKSLQYLIHHNDPDKFPYSIDEVHGSLKKYLNRLIENDNKDENDKAQELMMYIYKFNGEISITEFSKHCQDVGMWDVFRRATTIFLKIIEEHNRLFEYDRKMNHIFTEKEIYQMDIDSVLRS